MKTLGLALWVLSAPCLACDRPDQLIFSCTTDNRKSLEVCHVGDEVTYAYGKSLVRPEISLKVNEKLVGTGRGTDPNWAGKAYGFLTIPNGDYTYTVQMHSNLLNKPAKASDGIVIAFKKEQYITQHWCVAKTIVGDLINSGL